MIQRDHFHAILARCTELGDGVRDGVGMDEGWMKDERNTQTAQGSGPSIAGKIEVSGCFALLQAIRPITKLLVLDIRDVCWCVGAAF